MNKLKVASFATILSIALVGCGGGSGSSSGNKNDSVNEGGQENTTTQESTTLKNVEYVQGIYNISQEGDSGTDEAYLHISETGLITTYDYLGDSVDNGENCYSKNPDNINSTINNTTLTIDEENKYFVSGSIQWTYDETEKNIVKVGLSGFTAGGLFAMNDTRVATSTLLVTSPSVQDMEQLLCE